MIFFCVFLEGYLPSFLNLKVKTMKLSEYNIFVPLQGQSQYLIYNTISDSMVTVDTATKENLDNFTEKESQFTEEDLKALKATGIIVDDNFDERSIIKVRYHQRKYHEKEMWFTVMTTYMCNLNCPYCYQKKKTGMMDEKIANGVIKYVDHATDSLGIEKLWFLMCGGEPLLNPKIDFHLIDNVYTMCQNNGIEFGMGFVTNGSMFTEEIVEQMSHYPHRITQLTFDGPKHIHDTRRIYKDGSGSYDQIMHGLELMRDYKIPGVLVRVDVDQKSPEEINLFLDDLEERGLKEFRLTFGLIEPKTEKCNEYAPICLVGKEAAKVLIYLWENAFKRGFHISMRPRTKFVYCGSQTNFSWTVGPYGDLYKCANFVGLDEHIIGHIKDDGTLTEVNVDYYDFMSRDPLEYEECRNCNILPLCGGGCAGWIYEESGTYHTHKCPVAKWTLRKQLQLYAKYQYGKE